MSPSSIEKTSSLLNTIISCSSKRFKKYGYKKTTVDDIAGDAHISKKTLYEIFSSKTEILEEVAWRDTLDIIRTFADTLSIGMRADGQLMALCRYIFTDRIKHGKNGIFKGIYNDESDISVSYYNALKRVIREIYDTGRNDGRFKPVDGRLATESVVALVATALGQFHRTKDPVALFNDALSMIADTIAFTDRIPFDKMG